MTFLNASRLDTSPIPHLVDGLFPIVGSGIAHGKSGTGKSYAFGTRLALDVANGVPFFGHDTIQGPVIYCLGEGLQDAGIRVKAQLAQHAEDNAAAIAAVLAEEGPEAAEKFEAALPIYNGDYLIFVDEPFDMPLGRDRKPTVSMAQFLAFAAPIKPSLVIYDAMADFSTYSLTHDTTANWYALGIKHLVAQLDCFVLGIGHDTEDGKKMLGAGRFKNAADVMIGIKPDSSDATGLDDVSVVVSEKAKYGFKFPSFAYTARTKVWDEPVWDNEADSVPVIDEATGMQKTALVQTHVVMLREEAEDGGLVMPEAARAAAPALLELPAIRDVVPPKRKRTGIKPATAPVTHQLSRPCNECGAPANRSCNPLPGSKYTTPAPGMDVHTSRAA